jgi:hypothetical protein
MGAKQIPANTGLTRNQKFTLGLLAFGSTLSALKYALFQLAEFWHFTKNWWVNL